MTQPSWKPWPQGLVLVERWRARRRRLIVLTSAAALIVLTSAAALIVRAVIGGQ